MDTVTLSLGIVFRLKIDASLCVDCDIVAHFKYASI